MKTKQIRIAETTEAEDNFIAYLTPEERRDYLVWAGQAKVQQDAAQATVDAEERERWQV